MNDNPIKRGLKYLASAWLIIVLGAACCALLIALSLGFKPKIDANQLKKVQTDIEKLVPGTSKVQADTVCNTQVYRVQGKDGKTLAWGVKTLGAAWGPVELLIVLDASAESLMGLSVLAANNETPGLGDAIKKPDFQAQFVSSETRPMYTGTPLKAVKGEAKANEIKAITGATVSSKGVCDSINKVLTKDLIEALKKKSTQNTTEIESNAK